MHETYALPDKRQSNQRNHQKTINERVLLLDTGELFHIRHSGPAAVTPVLRLRIQIVVVSTTNLAFCMRRVFDVMAARE